MNRTLLVEEGDDDGDNRQDKKKREKEKFPDAAGNNNYMISLKEIFLDEIVSKSWFSLAEVDMHRHSTVRC